MKEPSAASSLRWCGRSEIHAPHEWDGGRCPGEVNVVVAPREHAGRIRMILDGPDKGSWVAYCLGCDWTEDEPMSSRVATEEAEDHEREAQRV